MSNIFHLLETKQTQTPMYRVISNCPKIITIININNININSKICLYNNININNNLLYIATVYQTVAAGVKVVRLSLIHI